MRLVRGWDRFWFSPADPTVLGLIRLCAGFIVLYVYVAYTYDLQTFFGKEAWLDLPTINAFRHEMPIVAPPSNWDDPRPIPPADAAERQFMEKWNVNPRQPGIVQGRYVWSVWFHVTDPTWMYVVHFCILGAIFLFAMGFCTRVTAVLTWIGMLSYVS